MKTFIFFISHADAATPCSLFQIVFVPSIYLLIYFSAFFSFLFGSSRMTRIFFLFSFVSKDPKFNENFRFKQPDGFFLARGSMPFSRKFDTAWYYWIQWDTRDTMGYNLYALVLQFSFFEHLVRRILSLRAWFCLLRSWVLIEKVQKLTLFEILTKCS